MTPAPGGDLGVIAGSGMAGVADALDVSERFPFEAIEGVGAASVPGHRGEVCLCRVGERRVWVALGRRHGYEGAAADMGHLMGWMVERGVGAFVVTSAVGGLRPALIPGELVQATVVLDLRGERPVSNAEVCAARDTILSGGMTTPAPAALEVDDDLGERLQSAAARANVPMGRATLACLTGPTYETPAEVSFLRRIGADLATMSAAPEIEEANALGVPVASVGLVTNLGTGMAASAPGHAEVLDVAARASGDIAAIVRQLSL